MHLTNGGTTKLLSSFGDAAHMTVNCVAVCVIVPAQIANS